MPSIHIFGQLTLARADINVMLVIYRIVSCPWSDFACTDLDRADLSRPCLLSSNTLRNVPFRRVYCQSTDIRDLYVSTFWTNFLGTGVVRSASNGDLLGGSNFLTHADSAACDMHVWLYWPPIGCVSCVGSRASGNEVSKLVG